MYSYEARLFVRLLLDVGFPPRWVDMAAGGCGGGSNEGSTQSHVIKYNKRYIAEKFQIQIQNFERTVNLLLGVNI